MGSAASWYAAAVLAAGGGGLSPSFPRRGRQAAGSNPASPLSKAGSGRNKKLVWLKRFAGPKADSLPCSCIPAGEGWESFLLAGFCHMVRISLVCCLLACLLQKRYMRGKALGQCEAEFSTLCSHWGFVACNLQRVVVGFFLSLNPGLCNLN